MKYKVRKANRIHELRNLLSLHANIGFVRLVYYNKKWRVLMVTGGGSEIKVLAKFKKFRKAHKRGLRELAKVHASYVLGMQLDAIDRNTSDAN